ncbi:MAG TPA: ABC transporter substrate-binding protein [Candidatus Pelethocola excrementipullorum]|nr:ABC transporter substrate-binding protein [Candidatus Pelethocola excrementipullorum]
MKKRVVALVMATILSTSLLAGCGKSDDGAANSSSGKKTYELTVSGIGGSLNWLPVYIAQEEGWFEEEGLELEETLFTNGPVQMESLSSDGWDIGCTGVGGVFAGVIGYDAIVVGSSNTDDGTQYVFAREDSDMVKAGTGNNTLSDEIYGSADTWKGKSILCNTGSVTQYVLIKTLEGFGLTQDDVEFVAMDPATAYSAFLAGEGDACVLTGSGGTFKMLADSEKYIPVASGPMADSGLMCSFVANKNSFNDPDKYEAMKVFMKVYFKSLDWMKENKEETVQYCVDMNDENGSSMDAETAAKYVEADTYYTLQEVSDMMTNKAEGSDNTIMDQRLLDVLNFFIEVGNYTAGDDEKFLGHTDSKLIEDVLAESKAN